LRNRAPKLKTNLEDKRKENKQKKNQISGVGTKRPRKKKKKGTNPVCGLPKMRWTKKKDRKISQKGMPQQQRKRPKLKNGEGVLEDTRFSALGPIAFGSKLQTRGPIQKEGGGQHELGRKTELTGGKKRTYRKEKGKRKKNEVGDVMGGKKEKRNLLNRDPWENQNKTLDQKPKKGGKRIRDGQRKTSAKRAV